MQVKQFLLTAFLVSGISISFAESTRLLRFPDIHQDKVAFVYAGDIYIAEKGKSVARQLTAHHGRELFPKFSSDGRQLAFSAEYNGTRQVYVMPADGGEPTQLTWYNDAGPMPPRGGFDYRILDWTPDGKHIMVRANRLPWSPRLGRYYLVPVDGADETPMVIPEGSGGMLSPDGSHVVYTPMDREFRTWKRHRGGRAQDVWTYDLKRNVSEQLTTYEGTDNQPMWVGDDIYFTSDRNYTLNLFRYQEGDKPLKVTGHTEFDVLWPSAGPEAIVYENGGWLYRFNPSTQTSEKLAIQVNSDRRDARPRVVEASKQIQAADVSPDGNRVAFSARGEIFTVPAKHGPIRNLTRSPTAREIDATWSPDGSQIAYLSDETGEYEIWVRNQSGQGEPRQVTKDGDVWRFPPVWSPDGEFLLFGDKKQKLNLVEVDSGKVRIADTSQHNDIEDYNWSPDSRFIAYVKDNEVGYPNIWIYSVASRETKQVTSDMNPDWNPVFDPKGRYLYFLSSRDQDLTFSSVEFNYLVSNSHRVYALLLNDEQPVIYAPKSDEVLVESDAEDDADEAVAGSDSTPVEIDINFDGTFDRVVALQDKGGIYQELTATESGPLFLEGDKEKSLKHFNLEAEEFQVILENVSAYQPTRDGKKVLFRSKGKWGIAELKPDQKTTEGQLALEDLELRIDPRLEWQQMYVDGWRILRDWFYDPNMHGMDWDEICERYQPLVKHVGHRTDLDYIFGEIAGEMNAGHIYVQTGDQPKVKRREGGLLGAELVRADGFYQIEKIFPGEPWHKTFYSPLAVPGVDVSEGDYVLAVNGASTAEVKNFYSLMENTGGDVITLTVNSRPTRKGARDVLVKTITSESSLRYLDWVLDRARRVDELSGGRIGYVHLPNTATAGNRELFKRYFPQVKKEALIIDVRYNGGGFIPDRMIEVVARQPLNYWARRGLDPNSTPAISHLGPKVTLINGNSGSGGDAFPYYFRKLGLGPLIGTRTWGGLIGLSGNPGLADGGSILAATFRFLDTDGNWAVENVGVSPDIEVIDRPELVAAGQDPTLERAVDYLLEQLKVSAPVHPKPPAAPTEFP